MRLHLSLQFAQTLPSGVITITRSNTSGINEIAIGSSKVKLWNSWATGILPFIRFIAAADADPSVWIVFSIAEYSYISDSHNILFSSLKETSNISKYMTSYNRIFLDNRVQGTLKKAVMAKYLRVDLIQRVYFIWQISFLTSFLPSLCRACEQKYLARLIRLTIRQELANDSCGIK